MNGLWKLPKFQQHLYSISISIGIMGIATLFSFLYFFSVPGDTGNYANLTLIYILALVLVSFFTKGYLYGILCSLITVIFINFFFTVPYFEINFTLSGYPLTFLETLSLSLLTSATTSRMSRQARLITEREMQLAEAEKEKMRANLLRAISHDLRTPLTGIIGNSAVYLENQDQLTEKEKTALITNIHEDSHWLLNMVENLLTITRISGDQLSINTSLEPIEEVLAEALQKIQKRHPEVQIRITAPEEFLQLPMDAILIEQVIINLLENAIVHSASPQPIDLIVTDRPFYVSFQIRDYGIGIAAEMLDNLFDGIPNTASQAADSYKGMGIGLSICKTIIAAHHGTISGRNCSQGAEFTFTLPKAQTPPQRHPSKEVA